MRTLNNPFNWNTAATFPCKLNTYEGFLLSGNRHLREQIMLNPT